MKENVRLSVHFKGRELRKSDVIERLKYLSVPVLISAHCNATHGRKPQGSKVVIGSKYHIKDNKSAILAIKRDA